MVHRYLKDRQSLDCDEIQILQWYLFNVKNQNDFSLYHLIAKNSLEQDEIIQRQLVFEAEYDAKNTSYELELAKLEEQKKQLYQVLLDCHYPMYPAMKKTMKSILKPEE